MNMRTQLSKRSGRGWWIALSTAGCYVCGRAGEEGFYDAAATWIEKIGLKVKAAFPGDAELRHMEESLEWAKNKSTEHEDFIWHDIMESANYLCKQEYQAALESAGISLTTADIDRIVFWE